MYGCLAANNQPLRLTEKHFPSVYKSAGKTEVEYALFVMQMTKDGNLDYV